MLRMKYGSKESCEFTERIARDMAVAGWGQMGWAAPQVEVIDEDLGLSGASSHLRTGFQRLVAAIGLGEVGIILVTEVSRLSRRNSDWHRVLELCAVFRTLIADEDRVYVRIRRGPRNFGRGVVKWSHGD